MSFVESVKEIAGKVGDTVDKGIKTGSDSYKKMTEKSRIKKEIARHNHEMNRIFSDIGRKLYSEQPDSELYKTEFDSIREKEAEIEKLNNLLNEMEDRQPCPQCGELVSKDARYCDKCGTRILTPEKETVRVNAEKITICKRCGAELVDAARFCDRCGTKLED